MRIIYTLAVAVLLGVVPDGSSAQVAITDWMGRSVSVDQGSVDSDGVTIVYHTVGEGPLIIFVHSITGPWFDFRHQMVALSERYRVVSMSTRGTGESDKPEGIDHYASAKIAGDINAIIDHFGEERAPLALLQQDAVWVVEVHPGLDAR